MSDINYKRLLITIFMFVLVFFILVFIPNTIYNRDISNIAQNLSHFSSIFFSVIMILVFITVFLLGAIILSSYSPSRNPDQKLIKIAAFKSSDKEFDGNSISQMLIYELNRITNINQNKINNLAEMSNDFCISIKKSTTTILPQPSVLTTDNEFQSIKSEIKAESTLEIFQGLGQLSLAGLTVSIGNIYLLVKDFWPFGVPERIITGSMQRFGRYFIITSIMPDGKIILKDNENNEHINSLIKDLAFQIYFNLSEKLYAESWEEFKYFTEALDAYNRYGDFKNKRCLETATFNIKNLEKIGRSNPLLYNLSYNVGVANYKEEAYKVSEKIFRYVIHLQNNDDSANFKPAHTWNALGSVYHDQNRLEDSKNAFKRAIEIDPESPYPWNGLGNVYHSMHQYNDAINAYNKTMKLNETINESNKAIKTRLDATAWNGLGNAYAATVQYDKATEAYKKAIDIDEKFALPLNGLGNIYYDRAIRGEKINSDLLHDAQKAYYKAIELDPKFASPWNGLGIIYRNQGNLENALSAFKTAIEIDRNYAPAWNGLGNIYREDRIRDAFEAYKKATKIDPKFSDPWYGLGMLYRITRRYEKAIKAYKKFIELDDEEKQSAITYAGLISCYKKLNFDPKEYENFEKKANDLKDKETPYNQACVECILGNIQPTLDFLRLAFLKESDNSKWAKKDPDLEDIHKNEDFEKLIKAVALYKEGLNYLGSKKCNEAENKFKAALDNYEKFPEARYNLAKALRCMGKETEADKQREILDALNIQKINDSKKNGNEI